jgi:hypothetical protein
MRRRRTRRRDRPAPARDPVPFDATRTAGGIISFEAGNGLAHGLLAVIIALALAILVEPLRRAIRALFRR